MSLVMEGLPAEVAVGAAAAAAAEAAEAAGVAPMASAASSEMDPTVGSNTPASPNSFWTLKVKARLKALEAKTFLDHTVSGWRCGWTFVGLVAGAEAVFLKMIIELVGGWGQLVLRIWHAF